MTQINQLDAKIYLALRDRLDTLTGGYAIVEPNETYPTEADVAFIVIQDVRLEPAKVGIGNDDPDEHRGIFNLAVMTPLGWTHGQSLGIAGLIRAHMPKSGKYVNNDVTVKILDTPYYSGNSYRDGAFNRLPVSVKWRATG